VPDEPDDEVVAALLAAVQLARRRGRDAETELRAALTRWANAETTPDRSTRR